jgi:hypothetical protein
VLGSATLNTENRVHRVGIAICSSVASSASFPNSTKADESEFLAEREQKDGETQIRESDDQPYRGYLQQVKRQSNGQDIGNTVEGYEIKDNTPCQQDDANDAERVMDSDDEAYVEQMSKLWERYYE